MNMMRRAMMLMATAMGNAFAMPHGRDSNRERLEDMQSGIVHKKQNGSWHRNSNATAQKRAAVKRNNLRKMKRG